VYVAGVDFRSFNFMFPLFIFFSVALAGRFETHNSRSFDRQAVERSSVKADLHVTGRVGV
jgi:hypothetical protein